MLEDKIQKAKILIVDDQISNVELLEQVLTQFNFENIKSITDPRMFFETLTGFEPDIVLLDLMMPHIDGYELLQQYSATFPKEKYIPIIVLTSDITSTAREKALRTGARDFLNKPFDIYEIYHRMYNLLEMRFLYLELKNRNFELEKEVQRQTAHLSEANLQLKNANNELQLLEEAKLHFLKIISHEIRTPLNGIKGFAEVIKFSIDTEPVLEYFNYLEKSVERLESFSYQALLLTQLRSKSYKTQIVSISPLAQFTEFVSKNKAKMAEKKLQIEGLDKLTNVEIKADNELFKYLINVVLGNAVKYAFENTSIYVNIESNKKYTSIIVSDRGPGLPVSISDATELPLFGLNQKHIDKNTGLDIILSRLIMQVHHGKIHFENNAPSGVSVTMTFPA